MLHPALSSSLGGLGILLPLAYCIVRSARPRRKAARNGERALTKTVGSSTSLDPPDAGLTPILRLDT